MLKKIFWLLVFVFFILSGCDSTASSFYDETKSTDLSNESIMDISLGSSKEKIFKSFGQPNKTEEIEKPSTKHLIYGDFNDNNLVKFTVTKEKVTGYQIKHSEIATEKDIKVGDSKKDILKAYGENYFKTKNDGAVVIGYFDKKNNYKLSFQLHNKEVFYIAMTRFEKN